MTFRWRIRHKLIIGLGLVMGIIAMLLVGTLYGLASYRATMKSIDSKLAELREAEALKVAVNNIKSTAETNLGSSDEWPKFQRSIREAEECLELYRGKLVETLQHKRDPDKGFQEKGIVEALQEGFGKLDRAGKDFFKPNVGSRGSRSLAEDKSVQSAIDYLITTSADLRDAIYQDLARRSKDARDCYKASLWLVISVSVAGVLFLCFVLKFFYGWVFYPIRDLQQGAGRVAQGDFEHRIDVRSGDEMEDLAAAFNHMTGQLRDMYGDLARQVNERSRQLVRSERLAGIGFLAAGVAHEINNPLASIAFCSEALEQRLAPVLKTGPRPIDLSQDREIVSKYLKLIQDQAFRCKEIIESLLKFSRGGDKTREATELGELIQGVLDSVEHLPNSKSKTIVFEPTERVTAAINGPEIKSVVLNLVVNALDSMDEGGTLTILLRGDGEFAEMKFVDTGCGMAPDVLENIFEPFFTRSRTGKGTGLGLSISHRVVGEHGGEIEADSPGANQGSTFVVRLPLKPVEPVKEESIGNLAA